MAAVIRLAEEPDAERMLAIYALPSGFAFATPPFRSNWSRLQQRSFGRESEIQKNLRHGLCAKWKGLFLATRMLEGFACERRTNGQLK